MKVKNQYILSYPEIKPYFAGEFVTLIETESDGYFIQFVDGDYVTCLERISWEKAKELIKPQ